MIGVAWNTRGLGGKRASQRLGRLVRETNPDYLFISETKIYTYAAAFIKSYLRFANIFCINPSGHKGGLLLFWNDHVNLTILSYSIGHIDCLLKTSLFPFYFTGFYGNSSRSDHIHSWHLLQKISSTHPNSNYG